MKKKSTLSPHANPYGQVSSHNAEVNKIIMAVDEVAYTMECKWGAGVLTQLVEKAIHDKFVKAVDRLNDAIPTNDYDTVKAAADNIIKGWRKLDELATSAGYENIPNYFTVKDSFGVEYLLVQTRLDGNRLAAKMPDKANAILTQEDAANYITRQTSVVFNQSKDDRVLRLFTPKPNLDDILEDSIPF